VLPPGEAAGRARTWATVERSLHESQQLRGAAARRLAANAGSVVLTAEAEGRLVNKVSITTLLITTLAITHHYSSEGGILRARAAAVWGSICYYSAKPIEMPFGMWTQVGPTINEPPYIR